MLSIFRKQVETKSAKVRQIGKVTEKTKGGFMQVFPDRNWGKFQEN